MSRAPGDLFLKREASGMRRFLTASLGHAAVVLLGFVVALPAPAAPVNPETRGKDLGPAEKLRKELDQPLTVDFVDQELQLALNQLHEQTKINFVLDRNTLMQMNIDPSSPVQGKFKDVKLRNILRSVLGAYNLGYAIVGDTVFVSSDEMAMFKQMQQRVSIDLDKVEFGLALKRLSRETATNLILDSRVAKEGSQPISLQVDDVPLETAVRLMAEMVGLKPVRVGNVLFVSSKANAQEMRADPDLVPARPNPMNPNEGIVLPGVPNPMIPKVVPPPANPPAPAKIKDNPPEKTDKDRPKDKDTEKDG
jgi:hypothetical protein